MNKNLIITKASGATAIFSEAKLRSSLQRAGATTDQADRVMSEIAGKLYEGIATKKIYQLAFQLLKGNSRPAAAKYHLKRAIMELGPSGYPFEKFVGELMRGQGYSVLIAQVVQGKCVSHEVDVIARKGNLQLMIECKYHNLSGTICDVKIPLYIQSRFKDVEAEWIRTNNDEELSYVGCVVTNTRFSNDAMQYGACAGLRLIGWDYPAKGSLKDQVDAQGLYPLTCLTTLTKAEKQKLLDRKIVLCHELYTHPQLLEETGVRGPRLITVLHEITELCKHLSAR